MPNQSHIPLLSIVTFLPLAGAVLLLFFRRPPDEEEAHDHAHEHNEAAEHAPASTGSATGSAAASAIRWFTLFWAGITFVASCLLVPAYIAGEPGFEFQDGPYNWIPQFGVKYHLGMDGIS